jgi:hypothetical protein
MAIGDASGRGRAMTQPHIVNDSDEAVEEERVLRWGGAAGVLGSVMLLGAFIVVGALGLPDTSDTASLVDFPDIETARIVENTLYLGALLLWTLHFIALRLALRRASLAPSLFGSALGIFGLVILAAGALLHVATGMLPTCTTPRLQPLRTRRRWLWRGKERRASWTPSSSPGLWSHRWVS